MALLISACGTTPTPPTEASVTTVITTPAQAPAPQILVVTPVQAPAATPPEALVNAQASPVPDVVTALLTYSERLRQLNPNDLAAEIAVQGDPGNVPLPADQDAAEIQLSAH
eukprot:gene4912-6510_t